MSKNLQRGLVGLAIFVLAGLGFAGQRAVSFEMTPTASNPVASGLGGLYTKSSDGKPRLVSASAVEYPAGEARHIYTAAGAPGGAVLGDCWTDSTDDYRLYCKESTGNLAQRTDVVTSGSIGVVASPGVFLAHADTAAGTKFLGGATFGAASAAQNVLFVAHSVQSVRYIACSVGTAPGGIISDVVTVQKSSDHGATWSDTASTCTVTGSGKTCSNGATALLAQFDRLAVKIVRDALSSSADYSCEIVVS